MAFGISPSSPTPPVTSEGFPNYNIQFQNDGTDLGAPADVDTVNFRAGLLATKGTGETANRVTVEVDTDYYATKEGAVNIADYGASPSASAAVNTAAIAAAHADSLVVEYPPYVYDYLGGVTLRSGTRIISRGATLRADAAFGTSTAWFENEDTTGYVNTDIDIRGITFDGNGLGQGGASLTRTKGMVRFVKVVGVRFQDCVFKNHGYIGLTLRSCERVRIKDCEFTGLGWDVQTDDDGGSALWVSSTAAGEDPRDIHISGCDFHDNYWSAIQLNGVDCRVIGNYFYNNYEAHIYSPKDAELFTHTALRHTIVGNTFDTVGLVIVSGHAIETCAWDSTIAGNTIVNCDERGIQLFSCKNVTVADNVIGNFGLNGDTGSASGIAIISNDGSLGTPGQAFTFRDRCEKVVIRNNTFYDDQATPTGVRGIHAVGAVNPKQAAYCQIHGNNFQNIAWASGGTALVLGSTAWDDATCAVGVNPGAAARTWTPVFTSSVGTITTATVSEARFEDLGGMVRFDVSVTFTDNGTGSGSLRMTLPKTPSAAFVASGWNSTTQRGVGLVWSSGSTATLLLHSNGAYPVATGDTLRISGTFSTT